MKKIQSGNGLEIFFEEYEIFKNIFKNLFGTEDQNIFRILDLGCGNGRFNLLIKNILEEIYEENKINKKYLFYGVEKKFNENIKNFSDVLINTDISSFLENSLKNKNSFVGKKLFNFVILSGIFENFLKFDEKILNKLDNILEKNGVIFINFWNYGEEKKIFREKNIAEVKKYFEENFLGEIKKSNFGKNFEVFFKEKQKNGGRNISLILRK